MWGEKNTNFGGKSQGRRGHVQRGKNSNNNSLLDKFQALRVSINVKPKWPVCKWPICKLLDHVLLLCRFKSSQRAQKSFEKCSSNVFVSEPHKDLDLDESSMGPEEITVPHPSFFTKDNEFH